MKVIEKGPGWNIEQICTGNGNGGGGCNSRLLVEANDIYVTSSTDITGEVDYYYTFTCPVCGAETDISKSKIPANIKKLKLEVHRSGFTRDRRYEL